MNRGTAYFARLESGGPASSAGDSGGLGSSVLGSEARGHKARRQALGPSSVVMEELETPSQQPPENGNRPASHAVPGARLGWEARVQGPAGNEEWTGDESTATGAGPGGGCAGEPRALVSFGDRLGPQVDPRGRESGCFRSGQCSLQ